MCGRLRDLFRTIRPNGRSRAVAVVDPFDAGYLLAQELVRREYSCTGVVSGEYIDSEITEKCSSRISRERHPSQGECR